MVTGAYLYGSQYVQFSGWTLQRKMYFTIAALIYIALTTTGIQALTDTLDPVNEFHHHEVVYPEVYHQRKRRDTTATQDGHIGELTLVINSRTKRYILDLQRTKLLIPSTFSVHYFRDDGTPVVQQPAKHDQNHCHYQGKVRGQPESVVAISTCSGVSGLISDRETYLIHPLEGATGGKHVFVNAADQKNANFTCGHKESGTQETHQNYEDHNTPVSKRREKRSIKVAYNGGEKVRVVEMFVVIDNAEYNKYKSKMVQRTQEIINLVNALWSQIGVHVALVGMEIWNDKDKMTINADAEKTINSFTKYRKYYINNKIQNDNAQLITGRTFADGVVGKAQTGVLCTYQYSAGVNMDNHAYISHVGTTIAHELGHNFGLNHDMYDCDCKPDRSCIMARQSGQIVPTRWSSCSEDSLQDAFHIQQDYCLHNLPEKTYQGPVCGNGLKEAGEECDCGLKEYCKNPCCDADTCRFAANSTCATGACCDLATCQYKLSGTMCRPMNTDCDLPEFCLGNSEFCPADVHVYNGKPCEDQAVTPINNNHFSYCYNGQCRTLGGQCKMLWGPTGKVANPACFKQFNFRGDAAGNCGHDWVSNHFTKCAPENIMCGLLWCDHRSEKLNFWRDHLVHTLPQFKLTRNNTKIYCKAAVLDVGLNNPDPGLVLDGAKCGDGKVCMKNKCTGLGTLGFVNTCGSCNGNGICNSKGHCHCNAGYSPPNCDTPGNGGSVDSGPVGDQYGNLPSTNPIVVAVSIILALVLVAAIILCLLIKYSYIDCAFLGKKGKKPSVKYRASSNSTESTQPARSPVKRTHSVGRSSSFRGVAISTPVLQDTTNKTPASLMEDVCYGGRKKPQMNGVIRQPPSRPPAPQTNKPLPPVPASGGTDLKPLRPAPKAPLLLQEDRPPDYQDFVNQNHSSPEPHPLYMNEYSDREISHTDAFHNKPDQSRPIRPPRPVRITGAGSDHTDTGPPRLMSKGSSSQNTAPERDHNINGPIRPKLTSQQPQVGQSQTPRGSQPPVVKFNELRAKFDNTNADNSSTSVSRSQSSATRPPGTRPHIPSKPLSKRQSFC